MYPENERILKRSRFGSEEHTLRKATDWTSNGSYGRIKYLFDMSIDTDCTIEIRLSLFFCFFFFAVNLTFAVSAIVLASYVYDYGEKIDPRTLEFL